MKALLIVDIQNDFLEGGALAVSGGNSIIELVNRIQKDYDLVVATQDWHPHNHKSFASQHKGKNSYEVIELSGQEQVLWPNHCVQGSQGAEFSNKLNQDRIEAIFRKGMNVDIDSYSGFYDNGKLKSTGLANYLKGREVTEVHVCGLAADYCVYFTAKDALEQGMQSVIIDRATKAIDTANYERLKQDFIQMGGKIAE